MCFFFGVVVFNKNAFSQKSCIVRLLEVSNETEDYEKQFSLNHFFHNKKMTCLLTFV